MRNWLAEKLTKREELKLVYSMTREDLELFTREKSQNYVGENEERFNFWVTFLRLTSLKRPSDILETASY